MSPDRDPELHSIPDPDPIGSFARAERRVRRLSPDARCLLCQERDPRVLLAGEKVRSLLDEHHVAAFDNDPNLTVALCLNHHAKVTAGQYDEGALPPGGAESELECVALALRSLSVFLAELAQAMLEWADRVIADVRRLNARFPTWRDDVEPS